MSFFARLGAARAQRQAEREEQRASFLLVDGDAVATKGWPHLDVSDRRQATINYLATQSSTFEVPAFLVLSTDIDPAAPTSREVEVEMVATRALALERMVERAASVGAGNIAVTDEIDVVRGVEHHGGRVISTGNWLDTLLLP